MWRPRPTMRPLSMHDDLVGVGDGRHPLGDDQHAGVLDVRPERQSQSSVGCEVECRERVVEHVQARGATPAPDAIDRRWRCPPDTFVPPWVIGLSRPLGIDWTKPAAWAISSACHSSSSVASGRPKRRFDATVPENRYGFCGHVADRPPQQVGVEAPHVDTVDRHGSLGGVEQSRNEVDEGRLARPGAPDDGGRPTRPHRERDVGQHRVSGAGVGEADALEVDGPVFAHRRDRIDRWGDRRIGVEDLDDAFGSDGRPAGSSTP